MIRFIVPGEPTGKGRPRHTRSGHTYTPEKTRRYEKAVQDAYMLDNPECDPITGPVAVEIDCWFGIPQSKSKKIKQQMQDNIILPTKRPDADNVAKAILDGVCNGLAVQDDSQVVDLHIRKMYDTEPRVEVTIKPIDTDT